ncbi:porin [Oxalobacteraceae bacterium]|nr:porin [Oxalobacteraceae bacterium]
MGIAPTWAQSNVVLYGLLDEGIERVIGVSQGNGQTGTNYRVGAGTAASRWGLRGSEDIGSGLKAVFTLEGGISVDSGAQGQGRLFGRQAWVGLSGDFGTVSIGRQYAMRYYALLDADVFGAGAQGLGSIDPGIPNARIDNAIAYRGKIGSFSGGINYSPGRDTVNSNSVAGSNCPGETADSKMCREWSVMAKYDGGNWGVVSGYEKQYGGTAATYGGLTSPDKTDTRLTVNAYYVKEHARYGAGWLKRVNDGMATPTSDLYWIGAAVPVAGQFVIDAMVAELNYRDSPNAVRLYALRADYLLSKRSMLYLGVANVSNSGTLAIAATTNPPATAPLAGGAQQSIFTGIKHTF